MQFKNSLCGLILHSTSLQLRAVCMPGSVQLCLAIPRMCTYYMGWGLGLSVSIAQVEW